MRPCTRRIAPAEIDIKATSLDADLVERAPWCRTAPDALRFTPSLSPASDGWGAIVTDPLQWTTGARLDVALAWEAMRAALLLADPDPHEPGYLERNLSSDGFDVLEAGWSSQALDMVERSRPDMVLAGETELCARLREGEPGRRWDRNIPVIVLTAASSDPVERVRAFERGADDVAAAGALPRAGGPDSRRFAAGDRRPRGRARGG